MTEAVAGGHAMLMINDIAGRLVVWIWARYIKAIGRWIILD